MGYSYDINSSKKDKSSGNFLFICHPLGVVATTFVSTFMVAYIYGFSKDIFDYVFNVGLYYISVYATFLLTYWFFSYITDKTNRVWVYRFSQFIMLVFVILIVFFGDKLSQYLLFAGFLYGLSQSCYYASFNVLKQEMVSRKIMTKFSVFITVASRLMEIIVPISLGALINASSYEYASIYVAAALGIIVLLSFGIKSKKPEGSDFSLKKYFKKLKTCPDVVKKVKHIYITSFIFGFTTITGNLLNICVMLQFGSSLSLGSIVSIIGAITILELMLVFRFTKPAKRNWIFVISMILPIISSVLFVCNSSFATVIIFNLLMGISQIIFNAFFDIYKHGILKEAGFYGEIAEHHTVAESLLCMSRVLSFAIMIFVGLLKNLLVFQILLVVFSVSYSVTTLCIWMYENKFLKTSDDGTIKRTAKEEEKEFNKILKKLKKDW